MKVLIFILFLIFASNSWIKADEVKNFEIEGMSVGDSLKTHFSKEKQLKMTEQLHRQLHRQEKK